MVGTKGFPPRGEKCSRLQNGGCRIPCKMRTRPKVPSIHPMVPSTHPVVPSIHPVLPSLPITRCPTGRYRLVLRFVGKVRSCLWGRGLWQMSMSHWKCQAPGGMLRDKSFRIPMGKLKIWFTISPPPAAKKTFFQTQCLLQALIFPDAAAVFKQQGTLTYLKQNVSTQQKYPQWLALIYSRPLQPPWWHCNKKP